MGAPGRLDFMIGAARFKTTTSARAEGTAEHGQTILTRPPVKVPKFLRGKRGRDSDR